MPLATGSWSIGFHRLHGFSVRASQPITIILRAIDIAKCLTLHLILRILYYELLAIYLTLLSHVGLCIFLFIRILDK